MTDPGVRTWLLATCAAGLMLASGSVWANCMVIAQPIAFGDYDPLQAAPAIATGILTVDCGSGGGRPWLRLELDTGSSGSFASRTLRNGADVLQYNLFTTPALSAVWGDGTGGSQAVEFQRQPPGQGADTRTIHARMPAGQNAAAGSYSDTIVVTLIF